jgi:choline kinase
MQQPTRVSQTVILAAGSGSRLATTRGDVPKPLMTVKGIPLIAHALEHARASGCDEAVIVIGYEGDRIRAAVEAMRPMLRVRFLQSPDHTAPNGISLLAAEDAAAPAFYLQMVDHLFAEPALSLLTAQSLVAGAGGRVLIDAAPSSVIDLSDATKVRLSGQRVSAIGKAIDPWDAIDAGCFVLTHAIFDALRRAPATARTVSSGMRGLVEHGRLDAVTVNGIEWVDVDTPADRDVAERMLGRVNSHPNSRSRAPLRL